MFHAPRLDLRVMLSKLTYTSVLSMSNFTFNLHIVPCRVLAVG